MLALYPVLPWWQQGLVRGSSTSSPADFLAAAPLPPAPIGSAGAPGGEPRTPAGSAVPPVELAAAPAGSAGAAPGGIRPPLAGSAAPAGSAGAAPGGIRPLRPPPHRHMLDRPRPLPSFLARALLLAFDHGGLRAERGKRGFRLIQSINYTNSILPTELPDFNLQN